MKPKFIVAWITLAVSLAVGGCAHQPNATAPTQNGPTPMTVTGSYLPQDVQKSGPVTNGKDDLRMIDRSEINRSGGGDLNQSLRQLGVTR